MKVTELEDSSVMAFESHMVQCITINYFNKGPVLEKLILVENDE